MAINTIKKFKVGEGFTLIEMLVSIAIVAVMSGLFLTNYRSTNKRADLNMAAQKLASDIRLAQNYSLGSRDFGTGIPVGGWGVNFNKISNKTGYIIFADRDGDKTYDTGESYLAVNLPTGIEVTTLDVGSTKNSIDITFLPPDPKTYIHQGTDYDAVEIVLKEKTNNSTKTVMVNFFGLVEVID